MVKTKETKKRKKGWKAEVLEWIDAIAVAVFLAMFARYFLVETYKIPTGSMEPTLWGEQSKSDVYTIHPGLRGLYPERGRHGDRLFVNKLIYDVKDPARWDIVVFRKPGEPSLTYIKRLWGLPGEKIQIRDGDIWVDDRLTRKPPKLQSVLWLRYYDQRLDARNLSSDAQLLDRFFESWQASRYGDPLVRMADGRLVVDPGSSPEPIELSYSTLKRVRDYRGNVIEDLCLDFDVKTDSPRGTLLLKLARGEHRFALALPLNGEPLSLSDGALALSSDGAEPARHPPLSDGRKHHVEFSNADGSVRLLVDGALVVEHVYDLQPSEPGTGSPASFGVAEAAITVENLRLRHDVYYTAPKVSPETPGEPLLAVAEPFQIPQGHYFFLGDNSGNSLDSRYWGTVPQSHLLGEAFFIFYPLPRWRFVN